MKIKSINDYFYLIKEFIYSSSKLILSNILFEEESKEYGALSFNLNNLIIKYRVAKLTPKKIGAFVVFWKRINQGPIAPYDLKDIFDNLIVVIHSNKDFGYFDFPKSVLLQKNILSKNEIGGKRGFRVYPPWDIVDNVQAKKTQEWQSLYFIKINNYSK